MALADMNELIPDLQVAPAVCYSYQVALFRDLFVLIYIASSRLLDSSFSY